MSDASGSIGRLFPAMIADWRRAWGEGDFPFLFVQIAPFSGMTPEIREAQLLTWQHTKNTAMAVTIDCGDANDIHPAHKQPVGARLALAARALAYGEKIEYSGPVFESMKIEGRERGSAFHASRRRTRREGRRVERLHHCRRGQGFPSGPGENRRRTPSWCRPPKFPRRSPCATAGRTCRRAIFSTAPDCPPLPSAPMWNRPFAKSNCRNAKPQGAAESVRRAHEKPMESCTSSPHCHLMGTAIGYRRSLLSVGAAPGAGK